MNTFRPSSFLHLVIWSFGRLVVWPSSLLLRPSSLLLPLQLLTGCNAESEFSSQPCYFAYQNATFLDETLATAMNSMSPGVFCRISESVSGGAVWLEFANNQGLTSRKKESAMEQNTRYIIGINNGIIVGYQTLNDTPNGGFAAYDLQCPNCVRSHQSYTDPRYPLTMLTSGIARCAVCSRQYDMNNQGFVQNGSSGDASLIRYVATTTGPLGYLLVRNR